MIGEAAHDLDALSLTGLRFPALPVSFSGFHHVYRVPFVPRDHLVAHHANASSPRSICWFVVVSEVDVPGDRYLAPADGFKLGDLCANGVNGVLSSCPPFRVLRSHLLLIRMVIYRSLAWQLFRILTHDKPTACWCCLSCICHTLPSAFDVLPILPRNDVRCAVDPFDILARSLFSAVPRTVCPS